MTDLEKMTSEELLKATYFNFQEDDLLSNFFDYPEMKELMRRLAVYDNHPACLIIDNDEYYKEEKS